MVDKKYYIFWSTATIIVLVTYYKTVESIKKEIRLK